MRKIWLREIFCWYFDPYQEDQILSIRILSQPLNVKKSKPDLEEVDLNGSIAEVHHNSSGGSEPGFQRWNSRQNIFIPNLEIHIAFLSTYVEMIKLLITDLQSIKISLWRSTSTTDGI